MPQNFFARFRGTPFRYAPLRASESFLFSPPYTSLTILGCNILDALKDLKIIPDCNTNTAVSILEGKIKKMKEKEIKEIIQFALLYPPRVRALLGAILEQLNRKKEIKILKDSLNPLSQFKLGVKEKTLSTAAAWNIK